jgi:predicted RNase H-like HicB family nuclease
MLGVVVGEGNTADEALADAKSAAKFHIDTFGAAATAENQNRIIRQLPDDDGVV